jgi:O-antigen ligase
VRSYQVEGWHAAATDHPFTGVGVGDFRHRITSYDPSAFTSYEIHSTYLGVWAETGVAGAAGVVLLFAGMLGAAWQASRRPADARDRALGRALAACVIVLALYGLANYGLRMRHLWVVFGLVLAAGNVFRGGSSRASSTP